MELDVLPWVVGQAARRDAATWSCGSRCRPMPKIFGSLIRTRGCDETAESEVRLGRTNLRQRLMRRCAIGCGRLCGSEVAGPSDEPGDGRAVERQDLFCPCFVFGQNGFGFGVAAQRVQGLDQHQVRIQPGRQPVGSAGWRRRRSCRMFAASSTSLGAPRSNNDYARFCRPNHVALWFSPHVPVRRATFSRCSRMASSKSPVWPFPPISATFITQLNVPA